MNLKFQAFWETWTASSTLKHPLDSELQDIAKCFVGLVSDAKQGTLKYVGEEANAPTSGPLATKELSIWPGSASNPMLEFQMSEIVPDTTVRSELALEHLTRYDDTNDYGKINNAQIFNAVSSQSMLDGEQYFTKSTHSFNDVPDMLSSRTDDSSNRQSPAEDWDSEKYRVELTDVFKIPVSPQLAKELALPSSYSFHETSFTRRLMRSSLEAAYMTLLNPKPQDIDRLCTYAFCFLQKPKLMAYFKDVMARTTRENLEVWSVPSYHVGNAGLHYPRDGIDASSSPPAWWAQAAPIGPSPPRRGLTPVPDWMTLPEVIDYARVGGEWFDSNDVEQYLRTKGLKLDAYSPWVEIKDPSEEDQGAAYQGHSQTLPFPSTAFHDTGYTPLGPDDYADTSLATDITDFTPFGPDPNSTDYAPLQMTGVVRQENPDLFMKMWSTKPKRMFDTETFLKSEYMAESPITVRLISWQLSAKQVLA